MHGRLGALTVVAMWLDTDGDVTVSATTANEGAATFVFAVSPFNSFFVPFAQEQHRVSGAGAIYGETYSLGTVVFQKQVLAADFAGRLDDHGPSFYRHLFWESGIVGQVLYLEAEAAGARATGIGCFYDDAVHDLLGLQGHGFQSLYHFTVGIPVEDARLTTEPGYSWEG